MQQTNQQKIQDLKLQYIQDPSYYQCGQHAPQLPCND